MSLFANIMTRLMRFCAEFELSFAEYRQERINDELAYGDVEDIEELMLRKSDIATEIHLLRREVLNMDQLLTRSI